MVRDALEPTLYGIVNTNRRREEFWGKNQFNSSFPVALACYMRDSNVNPVYIKLTDDLRTSCVEIGWDDVFGTTAPNSELYFGFESKFEPYQAYSYDDIGGVDVIIKQGRKWLRPLEIKLTVIPDQTTFNEAEEQWGAELVVRPITTSYCVLGIADSCNDEFPRIRKIIEPVASRITQWNNPYEIEANRSRLLDSLNEFQSELQDKQRPFLMQPIWKTEGKQSILCEDAFDIFIWSDFALCRTFIDRSNEGSGVNRYMRSSVRLARVLYELSTIGKARISDIYAQMTFNLQTDKEFSLSGRITREYMNSPRRIRPALRREVVRAIILNGGEKLLSPERRFDQTIYFTASQLFDEDCGQ